MNISRFGEQMEQRDILPMMDELRDWLYDVVCNLSVVSWFPGSVN